MNNKKGIIIIISLLVMYALIMVFIFVFQKQDDVNIGESNQSSQEKENKTISNEIYYILTNHGSIVYKDNKWESISSYDIKDESKYKTYVGESYLGDYNLIYGGIWNILDNDEYKPYDNELIAFSLNMGANLRKASVRELNSDDRIFIISNFGYKNFDYLLYNQVYEIDLDSNGIEDKIVCVDNFDVSELNRDNYYSLVYVILNNELITLVNDHKKNNYYSVVGIFNKNNELNNSIILRRITNYENDNSTDSLLIVENRSGKYSID